jgi:hypothetical protein
MLQVVAAYVQRAYEQDFASLCVSALSTESS